MLISKHLFSRRAAFLLMLVMIGVGCTREVNQPPLPATSTSPPASPLPDTPEPLPTAAPTIAITSTSIPTSEPEPQEGLLYSDDFTKTDSGWNQIAFDNSYIGYHEPGYYHVEVHTPHADELVPIPGQSFTDFTAEAEVFADADLSIAEGDFSYGLVFRRSGNLYYAFTISPMTKNWLVTKNSQSGSEILQEGNEEAIQGVGVANILRIDARGEAFTFHINGEPVARLRDDAYTHGEVGFYVQTFDNSKAHIHFDTITIREVEIPQLLCNVVVQSVNMRSGPGKDFRRLNTFVLGDQFEPIGLTPDGLWIQVRVEEGGQLGWVANDRPYAACNGPIEDLPISEP